LFVGGWVKLSHSPFMPTALVWTVLALQVALAVILFQRKLYRPRRFPFFTAYTLYSIVATTLRKVVTNGAKSYYALYWSTEVIYGVLALLALNDVFRRLHRLDYKDHRWFRLLLPITGLFIVIAAVWEAFHNPPTHGNVPRIVSAIFWFDLGVHGLEASIPLLFLLLKPFFLPPKSKYDLGVLWGFGVSALVTIVVDAARSSLGQQYEGWFRYAPPVGYALATIIWLRAFYQRPDWKPASEETVDALLAFMLRTENAFKEILKDLGLRREIQASRSLSPIKSLENINFLFSEQNKQVAPIPLPLCINNPGVLSNRRGDQGNMLKHSLVLTICTECVSLLGLRALFIWATEQRDRGVDEVIEPLRKVEEIEVRELFDPQSERTVGLWKFKVSRPAEDVVERMSDDRYLEELADRIKATPAEQEAIRSELTKKLVNFWSIDVCTRREQRGRLDLAREYVRRMEHNAGILGQWGNTEAFYLNECNEEDSDFKVEAPEIERQSEKILRLRKSALKVSTSSRLVLGRMFFLMLIRFDKTRFLPVPSVAALRKIGSTDLVKAYEELKEAALDLAKEYGEEYASSLAAAM
jgi:hypothetical protein